MAGSSTSMVYLPSLLFVLAALGLGVFFFFPLRGVGGYDMVSGTALYDLGLCFGDETAVVNSRPIIRGFGMKLTAQ